MKIRNQQNRRWLDKFLAGDEQHTNLYMSQKQLDDLRVSGNIYRKVAITYFSSKKFDDNFAIVSSLLMFVYKRGALVRTLEDDDLFDYLFWFYNKGLSMMKLQARAACIIDFFLVLLQEGFIQRNNLFKVYQLFILEEQLFASVERGSTLKKLERDGHRRQAFNLQQTFPPPSMSQHSSLADPTQNTWGGRKLGKVLVAVLSAVSLTYIGYEYWITQPRVVEESMVSTDAQQKSDTASDQSSTTALSHKPSQYNQNGNVAKIKKYFFANEMQYYYCRDYLQIPCNHNDLIVNPLLAETENIFAGHRHYLAQCARCHGETGRGNGEDAVFLNLSRIKLGWVASEILERDAYLFWVVAEGGQAVGGHMPSFKGILKEQEIWQVLLFLDTLR